MDEIELKKIRKFIEILQDTPKTIGDFRRPNKKLEAFCYWAGLFCECILFPETSIEEGVINEEFTLDIIETLLTIPTSDKEIKEVIRIKTIMQDMLKIVFTNESVISINFINIRNI